MEKFLVLTVLFALISTNWAAVYRVRNTAHPDYPDQCYVENERRAYPFGVHHPEGKCYEIVCYNDFSLRRNECGKVETGLGYHNEIDYTRPYPDCCVNIKKDDI